MKRIVRLTETDLTRIVKRVISEQLTREQALAKAQEMIKNGPKPTESGAKYCFTKEFLAQQILNQGAKNLGMYKIKSGDSESKIIDYTGTDQKLKPLNPRCEWGSKDIKANDVILFSKMPAY
jgi:hypothetical protein